MSNGVTKDWADRDKKREAIVKVLRYLAQHPDEALSCVGDDQKAHALFKRVGQIDIPEAEGARVILFAPGEKKLGPEASVIIELPEDPAAAAKASDTELLRFVLGNYAHW
jgi:hypothetical protein